MDMPGQQNNKVGHWARVRCTTLDGWMGVREVFVLWNTTVEAIDIFFGLWNLLFEIDPSYGMGYEATIFRTTIFEEAVSAAI